VHRTPEFSVVIPLTDARGDAIEHLRTWTHGQSLTRERYQVVIASDGAEPDVDRAVEALLEQQDSFEVIPGAGLLRLYNAAAGAARLAALDGEPLPGRGRTASSRPWRSRGGTDPGRREDRSTDISRQA
jgi:hypothetical protein